jgi:hypothetical protein
MGVNRVRRPRFSQTNPASSLGASILRQRSIARFDLDVARPRSGERVIPRPLLNDSTAQLLASAGLHALAWCQFGLDRRRVDLSQSLSVGFRASGARRASAADKVRRILR